MTGTCTRTSAGDPLGGVGVARLGVSSQVERLLRPGMVAMGILHTMVCTY